jgi:hypothetical protein
MDLSNNVQFCIQNRSIINEMVRLTIVAQMNNSEEQCRDALLRGLEQLPEFHSTGWYDPPPAGIGVIFSNDSDGYKRSQFPTLRDKKYWPSAKSYWTKETVGMIYLSPVHKASGIISDFGVAFYLGKSKYVQDHLRNSLEATEDIAQRAEIGMTFKQLYAIAADILEERGLHNDWMITFNDPTHGSDYGHTIPWTYKLPTEAEQKIIKGEDFDGLRRLISTNRIYINPIEEFSIPENIAFSIEPRIGSKKDPNLPCGYYYCLVIFQNGQKKVVSNFNPIFDTLGITYMRSRF